MTDDKRTTTIELTPEDENCIRAIKKSTGETSIVAAIRYGLRAGVREIARYQRLSDQILGSENADPD